jgi:hypothetical protein
MSISQAFMKGGGSIFPGDFISDYLQDKNKKANMSQTNKTPESQQ